MNGNQCEVNYRHFLCLIVFASHIHISTTYAKRWWSISNVGQSHQHCSLTSKMLVTRVLNFIYFRFSDGQRKLFNLFFSWQRNLRLTLWRQFRSVSMANHSQIPMLISVDLEMKYSSHRFLLDSNSRCHFSCRSWPSFWESGEFINRRSVWKFLENVSPIKFCIQYSRFVSKEIDEQFRAIVYQIIHEREVVDKTPKDDLLQVILNLREKLGKDVITDGIIAGHSMTFLVPETFWNSN